MAGQWSVIEMGMMAPFKQKSGNALGIIHDDVGLLRCMPLQAANALGNEIHFNDRTTNWTHTVLSVFQTRTAHRSFWKAFSAQGFASQFWAERAYITTSIYNFPIRYKYTGYPGIIYVSVACFRTTNDLCCKRKEVLDIFTQPVDALGLMLPWQRPVGSVNCFVRPRHDGHWIGFAESTVRHHERVAFRYSNSFWELWRWGWWG